MSRGRRRMADPDGIDSDVREALAVVLRERNRMIYWRLLCIFLAVVIAATVILYEQSAAKKRAEATRAATQAQFERGIVLTCHQNQANVRKFNDLIDRLLASYSTSPVLTQAQRDARVAFLKPAKQTVPTCPPRR